MANAKEFNAAIAIIFLRHLHYKHNNQHQSIVNTVQGRGREVDSQFYLVKEDSKNIVASLVKTVIDGVAEGDDV